MSGIALPAFHITAIKKHALEFSHALQQDLEAYRAFYKQAYGADVSEVDLIREIVRAFLMQDEAFRLFKAGAPRRSRQRLANGHVPAPAPGGDGSATSQEAVAKGHPTERSSRP